MKRKFFKRKRGSLAKTFLLLSSNRLDMTEIPFASQPSINHTYQVLDTKQQTAHARNFRSFLDVHASQKNQVISVGALMFHRIAQEVRSRHLCRSENRLLVYAELLLWQDRLR